MSGNGISRVHYFEQQFLRKQEFEDEQKYHLNMRRRHNIAQHTWGIVYGLELTVEENTAFVTPGLAVDGYGREIILTQKQPLAIKAFVENDSDVLNVWIAYDQVGSDQTPEGYISCKNGDGSTFYRWQEKPIVYLSRPDLAQLDRREPESVPPEEWDFAPYHTPPDSPEQDWPIFLGQIHREGQEPDFEYTRVLADRPYVGLRGESIQSPSGKAVVLIGEDLLNNESHFVVSTWDVSNQALAERLRINRGGELDIFRPTTVHGDVTLAGGSIEFSVGTADSVPARPWRIYRTQSVFQKPAETVGTGDSGDAGAAGQNESSKIIQNELRIEMAKGAHNAVVVGFWSTEAKAFVPCLTITDHPTDDKGQVQIHGNLLVQGKIVADEVPASIPFDPDAQNLAKAAMLSGIGGASSLLDKFYRSPYGSDLEIVANLLSSNQGRASVAGVLLESGEAEDFLIIVLDEQTGMVALHAALADDAARLENFLAAILSSTGGRDAAITSLEGSLENLEAFTSSILASEISRNAAVASLLETNVGRQTVIQNLLTSAHLDTFTDQMAAAEATREAVALSLLIRPDGRQTLVSSLAEDITTPDLNDFTDRFTGNPATRASTITYLLEIPPARRNITDSLLSSSEGRRDIAQSMDDNGTWADFAAFLLDEFPTLANNLLTALTPP